MKHSFGYYVREVKDKCRNFKYFFINAMKFRKFLCGFREWDGGYCLQDFFADYLYTMHKFYSSSSKVMQSEESRIEIVDELEKALDMLQPAFDELLHLEDEKEFDWDIMFEKTGENSERLVFGGDCPTAEDYERTARLYENDRVRFFTFIARNYPRWWD